MIKGLHAMFFSPKAEELRAFIRDKLELPFTDTGDGWLIFAVKDAEIGCHPSDKSFQGLSFYCDDIYATVSQLKERGVEFTSDIREQEWGCVTTFRIPDGTEVDLYQPKYAKETRS
jgi:predicted enzyme related to lactoylglutathione lyase